jgi:hypothetical protein
MSALRIEAFDRAQSFDPPQEEAFRFFGRPRNLAWVTPPRLDFCLLTPWSLAPG